MSSSFNIPTTDEGQKRKRIRYIKVEVENQSAEKSNDRGININYFFYLASKAIDNFKNYFGGNNFSDEEEDDYTKISQASTNGKTTKKKQNINSLVRKSI